MSRSLAGSPCQPRTRPRLGEGSRRADGGGLAGRWLGVISLGLLGGSSLGGCSDTVAFLSLELEVQERQPAIICDGDPRRAASLSLRAECDGGTVEETYAPGAGAVSLSGVPLGPCTIRVQVINKHGRTVLSGQEAATIEEGENPSVTITLLEESCTGACDEDSDGLALIDEKGLGTSPQQRDTDGDGLYDGLELTHCCSNPTVKDGQGCKLLIQKVDPGLGKPGDWVLVKTTTTLEDPKVELGGAALDAPLKDGTTLFGRVAKTAVLGEVSVTPAKGTGAAYNELFATLLGDPEMAYDLDQKAGAQTLLMQQITDMMFVDKALVVLGQSGSGGVGIYPVLLVVDRSSGTSKRTLLPDRGTPVAMAIVKDRAAVLLGAGSTKATLLSFKLDAAAKMVGLEEIPLPHPYPVDLVLEPSGQAAQVLYRSQFSRVALDGSKTIQSLKLKGLPPSVAQGTLPMLDVQCTGLVYGESQGASPGQGLAAAACSGSLTSCTAGSSCPSWVNLVLLGPVAACMQKAASLQGGNLTGCLNIYVSKGTGQTLGAPVMDPATGRLYQLTTSGLYMAALSSAASKDHVLLPLSQFKPDGTSQGPRRLAFNVVSGQLFAVEGTWVRRLQPWLSDATARLGKPFVVGREQEEATALAMTTDGTLLSVARSRGGTLHSVLSVCLKRCTGCLCP